MLQNVDEIAPGVPPQLRTGGPALARAEKPVIISMDERDDVAIVANDSGLSAGTALPSGLVLRDHVPQGHKVALEDFAEGATVRRYNVPIGLR